MKEYQRKAFLERIDRDGLTIGGRIPTHLTLDGHEFALRDFVFEFKRSDTYTTGHSDRVEQVTKELRRERVRLRNRLANEDIPVEEGEQLVEKIIGIDRALNVITNTEPTDLEAAVDQQAAADQERWIQFLKQALGHENDKRR